jgi:glycosyltransferase involved in cell wall biosynthesis
MDRAKPSLAIVVLTHNEEMHLERAIRSASSVASEIFVIDSGSTDRTLEIATACGAKVLSNPWVNYAVQFEWALENAPIQSDWVMRLDADEVIEPDLAAEIAAKLHALPESVTGVNLKRKHVFMGRWIRHGGRYPLVLLRIWRRGMARIEQRWMDEHMLLSSGRAITFEGGFADININDIGFFTAKHNKYATREAVDVINQRRNLFPRDQELANDGLDTRAGFTRWAKEEFYNRIPFEISALGYFLMRYILQLGFLDGREGAIYHGLQGFWYRFLVGAKVVEFERALGDLSGPAAIHRLAELSGLQLSRSEAISNRVPEPAEPEHT